jgi:hypothetical protein
MNTLDHRLETVNGPRIFVVTDAAANLIAQLSELNELRSRSEKRIYQPEDRDAKPSKRNTHLQKGGRLNWRPLSFLTRRTGRLP